MSKPYFGALVACSASKLDRAAPARDLYTSALFRKALAYAEIAAERVWILSALHGAVELDRVIEPYDFSIAKLTQREREQWACCHVAGPLPHGQGRKIMLLCGSEYATPCRSALRDQGWQTDEPMARLQVGERLAWLNRKIQDARQVGLFGGAA